MMQKKMMAFRFTDTTIKRLDAILQDWGKAENERHFWFSINRTKVIETLIDREYDAIDKRLRAELEAAAAAAAPKTKRKKLKPQKDGER